MAAPFSYDSDIAPLRGNNFGGVLSPSYFAQQNLDRESMNLRRESMAVKIAEINQAAENQARRSELAFQEAQINLQRARKQIQDELAFEKVKPELESTLNSILSDPTKDVPTKMMDLAKTRNQIFSKIGANPQVNSIFEANAEALKTKDLYSQQRNQAAYAAAQLGDKAAVEKIVGKDTEQGLIYGTLADAAAAENKKKGEATAQTALFEQTQEQQKTILGNWKDQFNFLKELNEKNQLGISTGEGPFAAATTTPVKEGELFDKTDRAKLEGMYKRLNTSFRNKPVGRDVIPDIKIFTETYEGTLNTIDELSGRKPQSSISEKSR